MDSLKHNQKRNIKPFNGEKYAVWKFRIKSLLAELNVLTVIESDPPDEFPDIVAAEAWNKSEITAKSVIVEYLSDAFLGFAKENIKAKEILTNLDEIYERRSLATQLALRKKLLTLKLQGDISLLQHFANFDDLITELISAGARLDETDKVSHLLLTMPTAYEGVITALETLSEDHLTIAFVKTRLLDQEVKLKNELSNTSGKVLYTGGGSAPRNTFYKPNKSGWKKNWKQKGFRQHQQRRTNFQRNTQDFHQTKFKTINKPNVHKLSNIKCEHCGRKNHSINDCYHYKRMMNNASDDRVRTIQTVQTSNNPDVATSGGFAFMIRSPSNSNYKRGNVAADEITFLLDSGATDHIVNQSDIFIKVTDLLQPIKIAVAKINESITAIRRGTIQVRTNLGVDGTLENVLYAPEVPYNLLSVRRLQEAGMTVIFNPTGVKINKGRCTILTGKPLKDLFMVSFKINKNMVNLSCQINTSKSIKNYKIWHERLGHIGRNKFTDLKHNKMVEDMNLILQINPTSELCEACIKGKQARLPFSKSKDKSHVKRPLYIVHTDVCGPITPPTINNKNYFVTFIDDFTHYTVTYLLTFKSDVINAFKDFVAKSEAHFNLKIEYLYSDNGGEYLSNEFKEFCIEKGITYHLTVPYTPDQNGVAERMMRTITEKARSMVIGAKLDKVFWGEAVLTATYLINLTPTKAISLNKTPYEMWHNRKPKLHYLRVFGSTVYIHNKTGKNKFDEKSFKGILVGYDLNGYKIWDVNAEKFIIARDVIIDEINFQNSRPLKSEADEEVKNFEVKIPKFETIKSENLVSKTTESDTFKKPQIKTNDELKTANKQQTDFSINEGPNTSNIRRSERLKCRPAISYDENDLINNYLLCAQSLICQAPNSFEEIGERNDQIQWEQAIKEEINSLLINKTWVLVKEPSNKNIIDSKWVFTLKNDVNGNCTKHKARLVARGFKQEYPNDYDKTYAPVARITTFRFLLALSNQFDLLIHQMDVKTAFLNGNLKEEIYMQVPPGVTAPKGYVCKLNKALYGLKQSARCWYEQFDQVLRGINFKSSPVDPCLYMINKGHISKNIYVILYVDDLMITTHDQLTMTNFKNYLMKRFSMVDLGDIKLFLGIRVERTENSITIDQISYLQSVLQKFNMSECKAIKTPLPNKIDYQALNCDEYFEAPCKNLIGCLMYVMLCTRPDLCASLNILSRYQRQNNKELWKCLKRVLRYIKGSIELKLTYVKTSNYVELLIGFVDSDWGADENDRKSTTGFLFKIFESCTIAWSTKRQNSVAASSTEAEYMALFEGVREALWLKSLLVSININITTPILIYEDNNSCRTIATNPINTKRTKHIDIKYHFSREQVENNNIILKYIPTGEQLADAFTKSLAPTKFLEIRMSIGLK